MTDRLRPSGYTPEASVPLGETQLCGSCATLIRFHPLESVWRHCIVGFDHPPVVLELRPAPAMTETERRLMDGNR